MRLALSRVGFNVRFAHDISKDKQLVYEANFGTGEFVRGDVQSLRGSEVPTTTLATASFPCTDLSRAGKRDGLDGLESGLFWDFLRVLREMGDRRAPLVLVENVASLATMANGADLARMIRGLNSLDYVCDVLHVDARHFVPQSRPRLFIVGTRVVDGSVSEQHVPDERLRPPWLTDALRRDKTLRVTQRPIRLPLTEVRAVDEFVLSFPRDDRRWWAEDRLAAFAESLTDSHRARLEQLRAGHYIARATAFRRMRDGVPRWEIRGDAVAGCLRATRGGSSRQALVEGCRGTFRVRWMTAPECARLQGGEELNLSVLSENKALFALGDGVCVPAVEWLAHEYLLPLCTRIGSSMDEAITATSTKIPPMPDTYPPATRSRVMRRVRSVNSGPEVTLRRAMYATGLRGWRCHYTKLPGKPDVVFTRQRVAIFVDGAFWHGHPSKYWPGRSGPYWDEKIARNQARDRRVESELSDLGWEVLRFWDFEVTRDAATCAARVRRALRD